MDILSELHSEEKDLEWFSPWIWSIAITKKKYSVAWVLELTVPTERPPLVGEVCANFCGLRVPRGQRDGSLRPYSRISRPSIAITEKRNRSHNLKWRMGIAGNKLWRIPFRMIKEIKPVMLWSAYVTWDCVICRNYFRWTVGGEKRDVFSIILPGLCLKAFVGTPITPPPPNTLLPFLWLVTWLDCIRGWCLLICRRHYLCYTVWRVGIPLKWIMWNGRPAFWSQTIAKWSLFRLYDRRCKRTLILKSCISLDVTPYGLDESEPTFRKKMPRPSSRRISQGKHNEAGETTTKLRGMSPRAKYTDRPLLVGGVSANFCG
jgi:hypothetical protein